MDIRKKLDTIMHLDGGKNWWTPELFKIKIQTLIPPEILILTVPPAPESNYNCFIYALGLSEDKDVLLDSKGFIYDTFFQKLLDEKLLSHTKSPKNGDYVLYRFSKKYPGIITHIGIKDNNKVVSKWAWGPLMSHSVLDVPESYGDEISYVSAITHSRAKELYMNYRGFNKI
ncbi:MAG: hypothetical protein WAZ40_02700 [Minisyncoccia bacterium]